MAVKTGYKVFYSEKEAKEHQECMRGLITPDAEHFVRGISIGLDEEGLTVYQSNWITYT